jgi:hypothetical protein
MEHVHVYIITFDLFVSVVAEVGKEGCLTLDILSQEVLSALENGVELKERLEAYPDTNVFLVPWGENNFAEGDIVIPFSTFQVMGDKPVKVSVHFDREEGKDVESAQGDEPGHYLLTFAPDNSAQEQQ